MPEAALPLITEPEDLANACKSLQGSDHLGLDTEFVRVNTYYPELCLVQISDGTRTWLIDALAVEDLTPLMDLIDGHGPGVIMHAARQDLEVLLKRTERLPARLWDSQLAAALLGLGEQVSYASLVEHCAGVVLPKTQTRTDWSRRPLSESQLHYAADDVIHLPTIRAQLDERIESAGRGDWLAAENTSLLNPSLYRPDPAGAWSRCKTRARMSDDQRRRLISVCAWREELAERLNRPRRWVVSDEAVEAIALLGSDDRGSLLDVFKRYRCARQARWEDVAEALGRAAEQPLPPRRGRPSAEEMALVKRCAKFVKDRAEELNVAASLLAARRDLAALVGGRRDLPLLKGWRAEAVGRELLELVEREAPPPP